MAAKPKRKDSGRTSERSGSREHPLKTISGFVMDDRGAFQRLLNDRVRLGILSSLSVSKTLAFTDLKTLLDVSDGNLSAHARKLEEAGFIQCNKTFEGRMPRTEFMITAAGKKALKRYLKHMEALIQATSD